MSKKLFLSLAFFSSCMFASAQYIVSGKLFSGQQEPLEGVSITLKDSYYGATSDKTGVFSFTVPDSGLATISFSLVGYKTIEKQIHINATLSPINLALKEAITELKAVVLIAGSFEAGDKKRTTVLKSIDVVTTAGQQADITAALKTLPGAQQIGEQEGLFVRGGTGAETKVFIDGMMVNNPFFSSVPGIAQRSRFSPLLFKGTVFSSGGYSAQYGQGLSSVLLLESIDLPSRTEINMIISAPQVSFMGQKLDKDKKGSAGLTLNYSNLAPYFKVIPQKYNYSKAPEAINGEFNIRRKIKTGMIKFYAYANQNEVGFERPSLDHKYYFEKFRISNRHIYSNATLTSRLSNNWQFYWGASFSNNKDNISLLTAKLKDTVSSFHPLLSNSTAQTKLVFTKNYGGLTKLYAGAEYQLVKDGIVAIDSINKRVNTEHLLAGFLEADIYLTSALAGRIGLRSEYSGLLNKATLSPRLSLAYKLNDKSQFSFAYGHYYQKPETNYLFRRPDLDFIKAIHYILNFQRVYNGQILRVEAFHKSYKKLLTTNATDPFAIENNGNGYAKGIELFWRDRTTIKDLDYWISYSLLDTKRKWLDYPQSATPEFAARHTLSIVAKRWVNSLSTNFSATYSFASGRPYRNPNNAETEFMKGQTIAFHSLGLQANYLRNFGKLNAVFILNVSNVLGSKQVYGYRYANQADSRGYFDSDALTAMAKRFIFLGMYLSIGTDHRKTILD